MKRIALVALFIFAPIAFAGETALHKQQLPPCVPVSVQQMSLTAKSQESVLFMRVYMPINIFKARAELRPKLVPTPKAKPVIRTSKAKKVQICKRRNAVRCTWWIWVRK